MNTTITRLRDELTSLDIGRIRRLAGAGFINRRHIEDVIRGNRDGPRMITSLLDISQDSFREAVGWSTWPEYSGVTLNAPCPLGGVLGPESATGADLSFATLQKRMVSLPDYHSLVDRYQPARNQGTLGTCVAHATAGILEGQLNNADHSEAFIYSITKSIDGHEDSDGSWLKYGTWVLAKYGACREQSFPYHEDRDYLRRRPSAEAFAEAQGFRSNSDSPVSLTPTDSGEVCAAIADGLPVAISVPIWGSSMNSGHFHRTGRFLQRLGMFDSVAGYHAMTIVAFFNNEYLTAQGQNEELGGGCFLVRNSWGPQWAHENPLAALAGAGGGYALMSYAYLQYCFEAFTVPLRTPSTEREVFNIATLAGAVGKTWWRRTRDAVVTASRQRLAETIR